MRRRDRSLSLIGSAAIAVLTVALLVPLAAAQSPAPAGGAASASDPVIAAVGDLVCNRGPKEGPDRNIAKYGLCQYMDVSDIVANGDYDAFFPLGDLQYLHGDYEKFTTFYDDSYGRVKDITYPIPGNHEYYTPGAAGYYRYFGEAAHPPKGWYSFELGDWHIIVLNTQLCKEKTWYPDTGRVLGIPHDGCKAGDPQYEWLKRDLAAHPNDEFPCTMALYHHPLFKWSHWPIRKTDRVQRPLWRQLRAAGADIVLNGHQHEYQRFEPLNTRGEVSDVGMVEIISGLGGDTKDPLPKKGTWSWQPKPEGLVTAQADTYGVLEMTLHPAGYDFTFVAAQGQPAFEDTGSADCR